LDFSREGMGMPDLKLTDEEAKTLRDVLTEYLSDLRMEIADTESFDLRQELKRTEALIKRLLSQLEAG
jgi:hypothetical protein